MLSTSSVKPPKVHLMTVPPYRVVCRFIVLSALLTVVSALLLAPNVLAAATPLRVLEDIRPMRLNDHGVVLGVNPIEGPRDAIMYNGTTRRVIASPGVSFLMIQSFWNDGRFAATVHVDNGGLGQNNVGVYSKGVIQIVGSPQCANTYNGSAWLGATTWGSSIAPCTTYAHPYYVTFGGATVFTGTNGGNGRVGVSDSDAGWATNLVQAPDFTSGTLTFIDPDRKVNITLPVDVPATPTLGRGGIIYLQSSTNASLLRLAPNKSSFQRTTLPTYPHPTGLVRPGGRAVINGSGTVVDFSAVSTTKGPARVYMLKPDAKAWVEITDQLQVPNRILYGVADINEWGDLLVEYGTGDDRSTSAAVRAVRTAITGTVSPTGTVASGRARLDIANTTISLEGGPVVLTARTDAKGRFSIDAPRSYPGLSVRAPKGTCLNTANGCQATVPLAPLSENGSPVKLNRLAASTVATFTTKRGAALKVRGGKTVAAKVRCNARAACKLTVRLMAGRVSFGTAKATIAAGKSKTVTITLTTKARSLLTTTSRVKVGATITAKASTRPASSGTSIQSFVVRR